MAATMKSAMTLTRSACCRRHSLLTSLSVSRTISTTHANRNSESELNDFEADEKQQIELEEEMLRDISGLTEAQKRRMYGQLPEFKNEYQQSVRVHRKLYGKLGAESGIDPRLSWTGRQKALELAQLLREWEPPLEERVAKLNAQKEKHEAKMLQREKQVAENMAKMDQWIQEYRQREAQKKAEEQKREEKKRQVLEEAREYFGYYVDPRDAKFQAMLEEKEQQAKLLAKKQKKEKRLAKLAAKLQSMAEGAKQ